jgi:3-deoxy-D-manno-octulosonate 8-phosphate phosphatase (KDO 8-P phosphatase)
MESKSYKESLKQITTFIFDVDGVLTDGTIQVTTQGEMYRTMHTKDGYALKTAIDKGYNICIISGGSNEGVRKRLAGLGIEDIHLGAHDKINVFETYLNKKNLSTKEVLYMGDDLPDLPVMKLVGLAACPQDAVNEIKSIAHYISHKDGGKGAVRDVIEQVLKLNNDWNNNHNAKYD